MKPAALCDAKSSCLIVIDLQEKLLSAIPSKVSKCLQDNTAILLNAANQLNVSVIMTAQYPKGLGDIDGAIADKLTNREHYFEKTCFSCLGATGLAAHLTTLAKKQIIIIGIEAHICVLQSAVELLAAGYEVFVVTDAIASRKTSDYNTAISRLGQANITLISTESVLFEWLRDASAPHFKALSKLIR